jgi:type I site-specific restriction endonuclease
MGLLEKLRQFFGRFNRFKAIQSLEPSIQSLKVNDSIASIAGETAEENREPSPVQTANKLYLSQLSKKAPAAEEPALDKESFQMGVAAGYTGRSIREIERSLTRIEAQMTTKDWFKAEFEDSTPKLIGMVDSVRKMLEEHDSSAKKRFEAIQAAVEKMEGVAKEAPEPLKEDILKEIKAIKAQIPLSPKMKELIDVVKSTGEIDYDNLANRLGISVSALRGLLSNTIKRTDEIERFKKDGKGWVRARIR